jgi:uncharacterized protein (TIGR02679 family)
VNLDPALDRALLAARVKREERGAAGDGRIVVPDLSADEALALDGLLQPRRTILPGCQLRVALSTFEEALRAVRIDPLAEYERVGGGPVRDLPAERAARAELRASFSDWLRGHPVAGAHPGIAEWLTETELVGRIRPDVWSLVERALSVVAALPAGGPAAQRAVLSARVIDGDPHALDPGTPLHALVVALLAAGRGLPPSTSPRAVWAAWGVLVDPVSSNVAALNLPLEGEGIAARLCAAAPGVAMILTYGQLVAGPLAWRAGMTCFSCENPSVLIAGERELGAACPPLVCTGGRPSDAVRLVFDAVVRSGGRIRHHGDDDEAGVQILEDLGRRHGAEAWRVHGPAGAEELAIEALIEDLRAFARPAPPAGTRSR